MRATTLPLLAALLLTAHAAEMYKIRGMAFSTGHDLYGYRQPFADVSLTRLKMTGANYVHISAYSEMPGLFATKAVRQTDDASIRYIIRKVKARGFKVFFKPVIEIKGEKWRGFLTGTPIWFNSVYSPFIVRMARIAQEEKVELFACGSEYVRTLHKIGEWNKIISRVRYVYKGKLTYVANHDSFKLVKFWHRMDIISISGYFKLLPGVKGYSPDLLKTKQLWQQKATIVRNWQVYNKLAYKKVLIAEIGAQSKGQGVVYRVPFNWKVKAPINYWEQVKMYEGILNAFMPKPWCLGVIMWNWELQPWAGTSWPLNGGYTPQNKPALNVMKRFFFRKYYV